MKAEHLGSLGIATLSLLAAWLPSAPVRACSCQAGFAYVVWPRDGSVDVPTDAPIVVERDSFGATTADIHMVLTSGSERIALEKQRVLEPIAPECAFVQTLFLRPVRPLEAGRQYTLDFEMDGDAGEAVAGRPVTFTTGTGAFAAAKPSDIEVSYLHVAPASECTGAYCEVAEVLLSLVEPTSAPYWLEVRSRAATDNRNRVRLSPSAWFDPAPAHPNTVQAPVVLPPGDRCVDIAVYALDGTLLLDEERCEPDRCALFDTRIFSTCGEPPSSALLVARIPTDTCDDPYVVPHDRFGNATYDGGVEPDAPQDSGAHEPGAVPEPVPDDAPMDAGVDGGTRDVSDVSDGCSVRAARGSSATLLTWLAIAALAWRRSRASESFFIRRSRLGATCSRDQSSLQGIS